LQKSAHAKKRPDSWAGLDFRIGVGWGTIRKLPEVLFGRGGGVEQAFKIGPYMTLLLVATVAFTISNLYLAPPITTGGLNCSAQGCVIAAVASAIGILLGLGGLVGIYKALLRAGYVHTSRSLSPLQRGSGPEEVMILAIAKETLSRTRRRKKRTVDGVYWQDHQAWNWGAFTRRGVRPEGIVLSSDLKERLVEEDWKILLGYYFPGRSHPRFSALPRFFTFMVPALLLALSSGVVQLVYGFASAAMSLAEPLDRPYPCLHSSCYSTTARDCS